MKTEEPIILSENPFVEFMATTFTDRDGKSGTWHWIRRTKDTKAVMIAASRINYRGQTILAVTKEFRIPIGDYEWGFPAGLIDNNETVEEAARREFEEETGLYITHFTEEISPCVYNSAGISNEAIYIAFGQFNGEIKDTKLKASEDITVHLMNMEEVQNLLEDKTKKIGAKAYLIMRNFADYGYL